MSTRCPICKADTEPAQLAEATGADAPLAVTVHNLPLRQCPQGHRQFARADFPLLLLDHLIEHDEPQLPASEKKGLLLSHYHCAKCGTQLSGEPDRPHTFRIEVALPDMPPFDVALTLPVHRCSACGHEQLHALKDVRKHTPAALARAFKSAEIVAG